MGGRALSAGVFLVATVILAGWVLAGFGVAMPSISLLIPHAPGMRANAAVCFILATVALELHARRAIGASRVAAAAVIAIATATLFEFASGIDLGIDQLVAPDHTGEMRLPGRMAPNAAVAFIAAGLAIVLRTRGPGRADALGEILALAVAASALPVIIGYLYDVRALGSFFGYTSMAPHTALAFGALAAAILALHPERGLGQLFHSPGPARFIIRRVVPLAALAIVVLGELTTAGQRASLFEPSFGMGMFAAAAIAVFVVIALVSAATLERIDRGRRETEASLRDREAHVRAIFDNAAAGIVEADAAGRFVDVNDMFCEMLGYAREDLLLHTIDDLTHPDDRVMTADLNQQLRDGRASRVTYDKRYLRADGEPFWAHVTVAAVLDGDGRLQRAISVVKDIDKRKRAEDALRASERRYRSLIDVAAEIIWDTDPQGEIDSPQPAWAAFTGQSMDQLAGRGWLEAVHPEDREMLLASWHDAVARGTVYHAEYRLRRHDGCYRHTRVRAVPVRDEHGRVERWLGVNMDIDDLLRTRAELDRTTALVRLFSDTTSDGMAVKDTDGVILFANPAARRAMRPDVGDVVGKTANDVMYDPADAAEITAHEQAVVASGRTTTSEIGVSTPVGRRVLLTTNAPIHDERGQVAGVAASYRDITERKRIENELAAAKVSAERAKGVAEEASRAKDHFLAVLSHELRTPLTPVVTVMAMLEEADFDEATQRKLDMVRRNVELEARLIDDLLDLTRITRGKVELDKRRVDLREVLDRAVEVCKPDIDARRVHFGVDAGPGPYVVDADVARLQQVFWNLLKNAVKFTPLGGCIGIRCEAVDGEVLVEVNDSGIGIEPEALRHVFDAFEQANRAITRTFGGLGLGLTISKALVEMHGGRISAHSEGRGQGTTMRVVLPLVATAADEARRRAESRVSGGGARVLLVEDHGDTAIIMQLALASAGYRVDTAGDVATALALLDADHFDVVVSDLGLPDASGHELVRELRARGNGVPAIALSGYGQEGDIQRSHEAGFALHLVKPIRPALLTEAVARVMRGDGDGGADDPTSPAPRLRLSVPS